MKSMFVFAILYLQTSFAAEKQTTNSCERIFSRADVADTTEADHKDDKEYSSRMWRERTEYFASADYSPFDLLIPHKYGLTLGLTVDADRSWELEYLKGSVSVPFMVGDLGSMTDQRFSLIRRSYFSTNSFNLSYGISYFDFALHLGDELLRGMTGGAYRSVDLVGVQAFGFNFAVGNRWSIWRQITLGVDWFSWAQPLYITQQKSAFLDYAHDYEDRARVEKALSVMSYFPRFALTKIQIGYLF